MSDKKGNMVGFRAESDEKKIIRQAASFVGLSMSDICRIGGLALSELILKNKKLVLPFKFKSVKAVEKYLIKSLTK